MKKIIVNADDFGSHEMINSAAREAFNFGVCRSASVMAGGIAFDDAVNAARECSGLGTGIHFTLVMGNPVLPPSEIPSLVNSEGKFHDNFSVFVKRYFSGRIRLDEVQRELSAQLEKILNAGLTLTHSDSHQHIHTLPAIFDIVLRLSESAKIKAVRIPYSSGFTLSPGKIGLKIFSCLSRITARKKGFTFSENFAGLVGGGSVSESRLCGIIDGLSEGTTEIMTHPGANNKVLQKFSGWDHDYESELSAITSKAVLEKMKQRGVEAVNFSQI